MSTPKKIIVVVGSTGAQGSSVAKALLRDGSFAVRAITRNPNSPPAQQLKAAGVEVVKADADDIESLKKAFRGVYGVFSMTDFWGLYLGMHAGDAKRASEHEAQHGKNIVDAAEAEGVQHLVWSTLESSKPYGIYAHHFESKVQVNEHLKHKRLPVTYLYTSCFFSNLDMRGVCFFFLFSFDVWRILRSTLTAMCSHSSGSRRIMDRSWLTYQFLPMSPSLSTILLTPVRGF